VWRRVEKLWRFTIRRREWETLMAALSRHAPKVWSFRHLWSVSSPPREHSAVILDEHGGMVACAYVVVYAPPAGVRAVIEDVVVAEECRGKGYGRSVVQECIAFAAHCGAAHIDLHTSRIPAKRLYESLGFRPHSGVQGSGGMRVLYRKTLRRRGEP